MGDHDLHRRCLSSEEHENPTDSMLHYLGCLEFWKRKTMPPGTEVKKQVETELRRIKYLRGLLNNSHDESRLVRNLEMSMEKWRQSELYNDEHGIEAVKLWRTTHNLRNGIAQTYGVGPGDGRTGEGDYNPDYDINAHLVMFEDSEPKSPTDTRFHGKFPNHKMAVSTLLKAEVERGDGEQAQPTGTSSPIPRNPISEAKEHPEGTISYFHLPANNMIWIEKAMARYFREPDLKDEDFERASGDNRTHTHTYMMLRRQYWEGQQNGGKSAEIHARHLRPLCETVSSDPDHVEASPRNVVLFMPYLHWETDRQREKISQFIDEETESYRGTQESQERKQKEERQKRRGNLFIPKHRVKGNTIEWIKIADKKKAEQNTRVPPPRTASQAVENKMSLHPRHKKLLSSRIFSKDENGRVIAKEGVGQVLFDAAMLFEAMSNYRDKMFIQKYLHEKPPLHPRRTLDQAYYWTLKTTRARDRDQVVYRGTKPTPEHSIRSETGEWNCHELRALAAEESRQQAKESGVARKLGIAKKMRGDSHDPESQLSNPGDPSQHAQQPERPEVKIDESHCIHCRNHIRRVSRLLMVDQLWMWILDEKTIITAFPRRYGMNKQDPSGVHKSIRSRLQNLRKDHIKSVFDLALIILDECSNTFFNRTKTADRQPQVLDIFSQAIGKIVRANAPLSDILLIFCKNNKQTISFHHLWECADKLSKLSSRGATTKVLNESVLPLLNISTEGELQREIKDVIDELDIMIYIYVQQRDVMKKFVKDAKAFLRPRAKPNKSEKGKSTAAAQQTQQSPPSQEAAASQQTPPENGAPPQKQGDTDPNRKAAANHDWFSRMAQELLEDLDDRIAELRGLRRSAESTSTSLEDLVSLKQQQASVVQAWQSAQQADEAIRQGRSIMVFTVITIVFLPLGFISSIFGMNNKEISQGGSMTLASQFKLMFGISAGIIFVVLVAAYSGFVRNLFYLAYRYLITLVLVKTPAYDRIYLSLDLKSETITRKVDEEVIKMKATVKKAKQTRTAQRLNSERQMAQEKADEEEAKRRASGDPQNRTAGPRRQAIGRLLAPPPRGNSVPATANPGPADHEAASHLEEGHTSPGQLEGGENLAGGAAATG